MFIERIDEKLLDEIQDALYEEHDETTANWNEELIDLEYEDLEDTIRSQVFSDYANIPLHMLSDMMNQYFPFLREKEIEICPFSEFIVFDNGDFKEASLRVFAGVSESDRERLSEIESKLLDKLLEELTQLYEDLDFDTTLEISPIEEDDLPMEFDEDEDEHNFVKIIF